MLERTTRVNILYDFYGKLLSTKQQDYLELYYQDDWSYAEIAEKHDLSRQGVHDNIKRAEQALEDYEDKLGLYQTYLTRQKLLEEARQLCNQLAISVEEKTKMNKIIDKIRDID